MIEKCSYCGEKHETGDLSYVDIKINLCPKHPHNPQMTFLNLSIFEPVHLPIALNNVDKIIELQKDINEFQELMFENILKNSLWNKESKIFLQKI